MPKSTKHHIVCEYFSWNLFERDGVVYADGRHNTPMLGKHSLGTRDREEALRNLRELDRHMAVKFKLTTAPPTNNEVQVPIAQGWERYSEFCNRPMALKGVSKNTEKRYRAVRDKHLKFCEQNRIETWNQMTKKTTSQYAAWLSKSGYADATIYLECTLLKQVVKWLIEEEKALPESHRIRLKLERSQESSTYCYSSEEVEAMIGLCRQQPALAWLVNIIIMLATTGMRIGEAIGLRWSDVDLGTGMITLPDERHSARHKHAGAVRTTKGRRSRRVPIHAALRSVLDTMPRDTDGRVLAGPKRGHLNADSIRNVLIEKVQTPLKERFPTPLGEIGFKHGRLHSFRHFFVSQAFLGGASEGEIREWVGHTNSRIVERYRHLRSEDAIRKMNKIYFFAGAEGNGTVVDIADHHPDGAGDDKDKTKSCAVDGSDVPIQRQRAKKSEVPASNQQRKETRDDGEQQPKVA